MSDKDEELILALRRSLAKHEALKAQSGQPNLNIEIAHVILFSYTKRFELNQAQRELAKRVIDAANQKVRN